jgi:hypothetical protein
VKDHVIVSDNSIVKALTSKDEDTYLSAEYIINFLAWREDDKRILTIPNIYQEIESKLKDYPELREYFKNFYESASFIGMSDKNSNDVEMTTLIQNLYFRGNLILFVSDDEEFRQKIKDNKIPKTVFKSICGAKDIILTDKEFNDFIYNEFFESSA